MDISAEVQKRRTFAIISHPDAGKTTLTEKLLLYGGAVQLAGSVTARKNQRATTSDWMELEKQRGISISSTVLQFDYNGCRLNLLDTPGHKDFSEDTYRVLTAVDSVVMVIDSAKGTSNHRRANFSRICRQRGVPIFTFMNKCDRPMKSPLALLDELERVLGIGAFPVNWPIGNGFEFRGVYDRQTKAMHLFERVVGGKYPCPSWWGNCMIRWCAENWTTKHSPGRWRNWKCWKRRATNSTKPRCWQGRRAPLLAFGSGINNFGVQLLLDALLKYSPPPKPRVMAGVAIAPEHPHFSGFIFKIRRTWICLHTGPHRVCARLFREVRARHDRVSFALGKKSAPLQFPQTFRQRARDGG